MSAFLIGRAPLCSAQPHLDSHARLPQAPAWTLTAGPPTCRKPECVCTRSRAQRGGPRPSASSEAPGAQAAGPAWSHLTGPLGPQERAGCLCPQDTLGAAGTTSRDGGDRPVRLRLPSTPGCSWCPLGHFLTKSFGTGRAGAGGGSEGKLLYLAHRPCTTSGRAQPLQSHPSRPLAGRQPESLGLGGVPSACSPGQGWSCGSAGAALSPVSTPWPGLHQQLGSTPF